MKTKVLAHEGVNIYQVVTRGHMFYKSELVFGESIMAKSIDEVKKRISIKLAQGDTRVHVATHEGVNIYRVTEGNKTYYISDPLYDNTIVEDTEYAVALEITRKHAMVG